MAMLIFLMYIMPDFPQRIWYYIASSTLIVIFLFRWLIFKKFEKHPDQLVRNFPWSLYLGLSTAAIWAYLCGLAISNFHLSSLIGLIHIFVSTGLMAAVMYSLSPMPKIQKTYILTIGLSVMGVIFATQPGELKYTAIAMAIFTVYLLAANTNHSSDLKQAYEFEQKLFREYIKLQEIFDSVPGFMIIVNGKGEWQQASKSTERVFHIDKLRQEIRNALSENKHKHTIEIELGDNTFVVSFERLSSEETLVIGLPISELKKIRTLLETQKAKADYNARLAAIGEMAGGVAHEINNPLSVISITSEFLESKLKNAHVDTEVWKRHTDKIYETSNKIAKVVKSLQNLTREDVLEEMSAVDLDVVIKESIDVSAEKMKRKGVILEYKKCESPIWVEGKHVEIGQVLINLINNSFEAIEYTGKIEIQTRVYKDYVFCCVTDTGRGIPEDVREKMFQPFFTTKAIGQGTGLGLSVSRSLIQGMGGELELLQSHNPTVFQIKLHKANVQ